MSGRKTINDFLSEDLIDITQLLTLVLGQNKEQLYTYSNYELTNKEPVSYTHLTLPTILLV